jgi:hypothetical protein
VKSVTCSLSVILFCSAKPTSALGRPDGSVSRTSYRLIIMVKRWRTSRVCCACRVAMSTGAVRGVRGVESVGPDSLPDPRESVARASRTI